MQYITPRAESSDIRIPFFLFRSLITRSDLQDQYPKTPIIVALPTWQIWTSRQCFKPEAHLLIEKYLSLKKESSRDTYMANMVQFTRARYEVSLFYFILFSGERFKPQPIFFFKKKIF